MIAITILAVIAGIAKAGRDTISHHFYQSIFNCTNFPALRKWFLSDWEDKPSHPVWFLWDGWHCFDTLEKVCYLAIVLLVATNWSLVALIAGGVIVGFILFYESIFLTRKR